MFKFFSFGSAWITDNFVSAGLIRTAPSMRHNCVQEKITTHLSSLKNIKMYFSSLRTNNRANYFSACLRP